MLIYFPWLFQRFFFLPLGLCQSNMRKHLNCSLELCDKSVASPYEVSPRFSAIIVLGPSLLSEYVLYQATIQ